MGSQINTIVDYTAQRAGVMVPGLLAVYGSGSSGLGDPLRLGSAIRAAAENPAQEFEHWSEVPGAPSVQRVTQDGTVELTWTIPMRLWFLRTDLARLRTTALPYFDHYLAAFVPDPTLGGLALIAEISKLEIGEDPPGAPGQTRWAWLDVHLDCTEQVSY